MKKKLIFLYLFNAFVIFSANDKGNSFEVNLTFMPESLNINMPRGISLEVNNFISNNISWGISARVINNNYTAIWAQTKFNIPIGLFSIPLEIGTGVKLKEQAFNAFIHGKTGLEYQFDKNWKYTATVTYNYNYIFSPNHLWFVNIGIIYLF